MSTNVRFYDIEITLLLYFEHEKTKNLPCICGSVKAIISLCFVCNSLLVYQF